MEPARGLARRHDESVHLEPKTVELLAYLASRQGEVVSRTELLDAIWPNVTVGDAVITNKIASLRRVFGDKTKSPNFIETISKRGYRLVAPVNRISEDDPVPNGPAVLTTEDAGPAHPPHPAHDERPPRPRASRWQWIVALVPTIIVIGGAWYCREHWLPQLMGTVSVERTVFPLTDRPSIAVLPFFNVGGNAEQDYLVAGMTDDLITELSKVPSLSVIARRSVLKYNIKSSDIKQVAEELGVRYVLEGSVRRAGDQVRINAKLIDARTGRNLWAERYDFRADDILKSQDQVTANIVSALAVKLTAGEKAQIPLNETQNAAAS